VKHRSQAQEQKQRSKKCNKKHMDDKQTVNKTNGEAGKKAGSPDPEESRRIKEDYKKKIRQILEK